ncbi:MAG: DNA repair protein RadA [Proteobacteria bacterium]|jgi:DNA repair protein RadA/Sms|nr:DNA repair protein RadA [Pseudomonadota bacterium]
MAKQKSVFVCNACGGEHPKWAGQCQSCGEWNTLLEQIQAATAKDVSRFSGLAPQRSVTQLSTVKSDKVSRVECGIEELDRVLGGGLVPGSVVLLGGDPGIGKSTLLLQCASNLVATLPTLYVSGEESLQQIAMRSERMGLKDADLGLLTDNNLEQLLAIAQTHNPKLLIVDSIQTLYTDQLTSAPGSVAQVRETAARLVRFAKQTDTTVILVGHVTKDGSIAGPRVLEHMVDTVLYFEGERSSSFRLIRAIKNRFGAVNEIGVFAMTDTGLREVTNPSAMFIERQQPDSPGSIILVAREGTRPLLVEVQALVDQSSLGNPRRVSVGLDSSRLAMLLAVLNRHAGLSMYDQDVFANVVGGVKVHEPAADLAVVLAVLSSFRNRPIPSDLAVFGELGLTGEVRPVQGGLERIREAEKLGFKRIIIPQANKTGSTNAKISVEPVSHLSQVLDKVFSD